MDQCKESLVIQYHKDVYNIDTCIMRIKTQDDIDDLHKNIHELVAYCLFNHDYIMYDTMWLLRLPHPRLAYRWCRIVALVITGRAEGPPGDRYIIGPGNVKVTPSVR